MVKPRRVDSHPKCYGEELTYSEVLHKEKRFVKRKRLALLLLTQENRRVNTAGQHGGEKYPPSPSCVVLTQVQHGGEKYPPLCPSVSSDMAWIM